MEGVPDEEGFIKVTRHGKNKGSRRTEENERKAKEKMRMKKKKTVRIWHSFMLNALYCLWINHAMRIFHNGLHRVEKVVCTALHSEVIDGTKLASCEIKIQITIFCSLIYKKFHQSIRLALKGFLLYFKLFSFQAKRVYLHHRKSQETFAKLIRARVLCLSYCIVQRQSLLYNELSRLSFLCFLIIIFRNSLHNPFWLQELKDFYTSQFRETKRKRK